MLLLLFRYTYTFSQMTAPYMGSSGGSSSSSRVIQIDPNWQTLSFLSAALAPLALSAPERVITRRTSSVPPNEKWPWAAAAAWAFPGECHWHTHTHTLPLAAFSKGSSSKLPTALSSFFWFALLFFFFFSPSFFILHYFTAAIQLQWRAAAAAILLCVKKCLARCR